MNIYYEKTHSQKIIWRILNRGMVVTCTTLGLITSTSVPLLKWPLWHKRHQKSGNAKLTTIKAQGPKITQCYSHSSWCSIYHLLIDPKSFINMNLVNSGVRHGDNHVGRVPRIFSRSLSQELRPGTTAHHWSHMPTSDLSWFLNT